MGGTVRDGNIGIMTPTQKEFDKLDAKRARADKTRSI